MSVAARLRAGATRVRLLNLREIVTHRLRVVTSLSVIVVASALLVAVFGTFGSLTGSVRDLTAALTGDADLEVAAISDTGLPADLAGQLRREVAGGVDREGLPRARGADGDIDARAGGGEVADHRGLLLGDRRACGDRCLDCELSPCACADVGTLEERFDRALGGEA